MSCSKYLFMPILLIALVLGVWSSLDGGKEPETAVTLVPMPTATEEPTAEPTGVPTVEPTAAPAEDEEAETGTVEVNHPEGTGACAARQVTMGGTFTVCVAATCDVPLDSGPVQYEDKTDVGGCTEEGLIGVCSSRAFDTYYYDGAIEMLQIGCGFMAGEWQPAGN